MDMIIKDYLEINHFDWVQIIENRKQIMRGDPSYCQAVDDSDIEAAKNDKLITEAINTKQNHEN